MVHLEFLTVPINDMRVPMTGIQIAILEHLAVLSLQPVHAKTIQRITNQRTVLLGFARVFKAPAQIVIMVLPTAFRMPAATVLNFVSASIAPLSIQGIVNCRPRQGKPNHPHRHTTHTRGSGWRATRAECFVP
jgi:hypothetical protein